MDILTVLNFITSPKAVYIVTDSSFSDPADMRAAGFMTKAYMLPHLEGIIAGTGLARFVVDWFIQANTQFLVRDMVHLATFAPAQLQSLYRPYHDEFGERARSTIYHWGYDRASGQMRSYAFRSTSSFAAEELGFGSGLKPATELDELGIRSFPDDYIRVMERQKREDEALPIDKRVGIGGHITAFQLVATDDAAGGTQVLMSATRVKELSGFEADYDAACSKLRI